MVKEFGLQEIAIHGCDDFLGVGVKTSITFLVDPITDETHLEAQGDCLVLSCFGI